MNIKNLLSSAVGAGNTIIDIESQVLPNIRLDIQKIISTPPNPFLRLAKPKITFRGFGLDFDQAPWGEPTNNYFPLIIIGIIMSYLLVFYAGYRTGK